MTASYSNNLKLCYMGTNNFKVRVKGKGVYAHLEGDFWKRFYTLNYEIKRPLPTSHKVEIGLMRDELGT